ncbi:homoserine kinase [Fusobacterium nucleatum CC53]|uniref:homoserine kinase n=1 Tax=Fusobacterium nucleatum TaxID=851 RepID=UPI0002BE18AE|nr:homoserine kinase [Fusobacterium nucleatum CC53]
MKNIDNGILNSNFYIETKNKKYILRIYEANRIVDEEKQELILLDKIAGFIPVSKAIKNIDNEYISIFTNKKFALFEYINGNSITKIDTHIVREIAMYLGKLHSFSKEISFEEYNRKTRIDFNFYYNEIKKSEINFRFKNELLNLANEINDFDFSTLPSGIIHGDIFPDNVLLDEYNNIKVIFDFNESYYAPFIFDIAIVINFWIKINDFDFFTENNLIRDFLNYYSKYRKITKEELKSLDIACKKIALTFIFLRIYKKKIENSYQKAISIQKKSYLDLIKLIDKYEK